MSDDKRWLDELPLAAAERKLLLAGRSARPPSGSTDAGWKAFSLALNAAPVAAAGGAGAHAASGIVSKAGAGGLLSAATAKSFVIGVALGVGLAGTAAVVERLSHDEPPPKTAKSTLAPAPPPAGEQARVASISEAHLAAAPGSAQEKPRGAAMAKEPRTTSGSAPNPAEATSPAPESSADTSLARQARELAVVKRLLDAGSPAEALRRLAASGASGPSALLEERDALYVQALHQTERRAEARVFARRFLERHPRSPYLESMRRLAEE